MRIKDQARFFTMNKTSTCKECGCQFQYFWSAKRKPVYCSNACKQKAYRKRQEEKIYNNLGKRWLL